jgi:hypothetical protein
MAAETGGSMGSFASTTSGSSEVKKTAAEDDDNLDELERYLESLSTPSK